MEQRFIFYFFNRFNICQITIKANINDAFWNILNINCWNIHALIKLKRIYRKLIIKKNISNVFSKSFPSVSTTISFNRKSKFLSFNRCSICAIKSTILLPIPVSTAKTDAISKLEVRLGFNCSIEKACILSLLAVLFTSNLSVPSLKSNLSEDE